MKSKTLYIALLAFAIVYTSCSKITEDIQEDIFVNDTLFFDIPILTDLTTSTTISGIVSEVNLDEQIKKSLNNFTATNIKTTKITSLNLFLGRIPKDSIDTKNNFGNLETIKFGTSPGGNVGNLASLTIPSTSTISNLALPPTILPDDLKSFLTNPLKTYNVVVKAKKVTTTPLKVLAIASYTITLSK